jgi:hypothetical protein
MANGIPPDGSVIVTADATYWTADETQWPSADGGILGNIVYAEIVEPVQTAVTADTTAYHADNTIWPTADGGLLTGATETIDATVEAAEEVVGGGGEAPRPRPFPVAGRGYGILPELEGEARGVICIAGVGAGPLDELTGAASGTIGAAGSADAQVALRGAAIGQRGICGAATGMLEPVTAWAPGTAITHGIGAGVIGTPRGAAMGQHDDDEAAVMAFLLAA